MYGFTCLCVYVWVRIGVDLCYDSLVPNLSMLVTLCVCGVPYLVAFRKLCYTGRGRKGQGLL